MKIVLWMIQSVLAVMFLWHGWLFVCLPKNLLFVHKKSPRAVMKS
jgi:hypothetical protein